MENSQNFQQILTGSLNVEKFKLIHIFSLYKAQVQVDKGPPHKTRYTETNRRESGEGLKLMGILDNFLNKTPMAYALRSRVDKWDLIKFKSSVRQGALLLGQNNILQIGKRFLTTLYLIEG